MFRQNKERSVIPIFGCRKRQLQAVYANPDDTDDIPSTNASDNDLMLISEKNNYEQQSSTIINRAGYNRRITTSPVNKKTFAQNQQQQGKNLYEGYHQEEKRTKSREKVFPSVANFHSENKSSKLQHSQSNVRTTRFENENQSMACGTSESNSSNSSRRYNFNRNVCTKQGDMEINRKLQNNNYQAHGTLLYQHPRTQNTNESQVDNKLPNKLVLNKLQIDNKQSTNNTTAVLIKKKITKSVPRIITTTIEDLNTWYKLNNKDEFVFEIIGNVNSTISYNVPTPERKFNLKDSTGNLRCVFWEIDRKLPQLRRGCQIRCVGKFNETFFHCLSVRTLSSNEFKLYSKLQKECANILQTELRTSRET